MRIINLLVINSGIPESIESFPIYEEQLSQDVIDKVEAAFKEEVLKHLCSEDNFEDEWIDYGSFDDCNGHEVYIIWSN